MSFMAEDTLQSLAHKAAQGDQAAFADLYGQTARRVYGLCRHMLASREAAEDATSEVFLKVQRAFQGASGSVGGSYDPERRFLPWLLSIAGNYCVDQLRRRGLESRIFATPKPDEDGDTGFLQESWSESWTSQTAPTIADRMVADAGRAEVRQAMAALPDQYRIPLVLRYDSELSYDEIAATMGLKRNNVATLIFRAKKELRTELRRVSRTGRETSSDKDRL
jgi:RNA polymerase sigma-70 factor (ECF subfamily)